MGKNNGIAFLAMFFLILGELMLYAAIFIPATVERFFLNFAPDINYSDLTSSGLEVFRVMIGILGSLLFAIGALMFPLSENYTTKTRYWILVGTGGWFLGDSLISYLGGFTINILSNILFFGLIVTVIFTFAEKPISN